MEKAFASLRGTLVAFGVEASPSTMDQARGAVQQLLNLLSGCNSCEEVYGCPVRRDNQWVWKDKKTVSSGHTCIECGNPIPRGAECVEVTCHHEGKEQVGHRCMYCHKVSMDYCSPLGHLREKVKEKADMDYVTGEFIDE